MAPSPDYKPHKEQKNGLFSFIPILVKQRGLIANIVLATLLVTVINIVGSYYLQSIIDTYVPDQMRSTLGIISIGLVIVYILQQILSYAQEYLLLVLGQRLSIDVILSYIKHVFHLLCPSLRHAGQGRSCLVLQMLTVSSMRWLRPSFRFS